MPPVKSRKRMKSKIKKITKEDQERICKLALRNAKEFKFNNSRWKRKDKTHNQFHGRAGISLYRSDQFEPEDQFDCLLDVQVDRLDEERTVADQAAMTRSSPSQNPDELFARYDKYRELEKAQCDHLLEHYGVFQHDKQTILILEPPGKCITGYTKGELWIIKGKYKNAFREALNSIHAKNYVLGDLRAEDLFVNEVTNMAYFVRYDKVHTIDSEFERAKVMEAERNQLEVILDIKTRNSRFQSQRGTGAEVAEIVTAPDEQSRLHSKKQRNADETGVSSTKKRKMSAIAEQAMEQGYGSMVETFNGEPPRYRKIPRRSE